MSAKNRYLNNNKAEQEQKLKENEEKKAANDKLFVSLKRHIIRERERKKQMEAAETAKEEQLRNEREARKKADKMTLGKTQQEIAQVEEQLAQLKDKKYQLFLQLKAVITKEGEMEKLRMDNDNAMNMRNDQNDQYMPYGNVSDNGNKRSRSPISQGNFNRHSNQGVHLPPRDQRSVAPDTGRAVLWYNPARYGTQPPHQWAMANSNVNNRYPMQSVQQQVPMQSVPQQVPTRRTMIDHQQPQPQLAKTSSAQPTSAQQKSGAAISIEKINDPMRPKITQQQQDFTIHRRINPPHPQGQPPQQTDFTNPPYRVVRYE